MSFNIKIEALSTQQRALAKPVIAQCTGDSFPTEGECLYLFDTSGGAGTIPAKWPTHPAGDRFVGYAGGINPSNVLTTLDAINAPGPYWIDVETGDCNVLRKLAAAEASVNADGLGLSGESLAYLHESLADLAVSACKGDSDVCAEGECAACDVMMGLEDLIHTAEMDWGAA